MKEENKTNKVTKDETSQNVETNNSTFVRKRNWVKKTGAFVMIMTRPCSVDSEKEKD
jgi:3-deoxy-D-arabino-heptulosonate 7-phosphate (DAHP) synthase